MRFHATPERKRESRETCEQHPEIFDKYVQIYQTLREACDRVDDRTFCRYYEAEGLTAPLPSVFFQKIYEYFDRRDGAPIKKVEPALPLVYLDDEEGVTLPQSLPVVVRSRKRLVNMTRMMRLEHLADQLGHNQDIIQELMDSVEPVFTYDEEGDIPSRLSKVDIQYLESYSRRQREAGSDQEPDRTLLRSRAQRQAIKEQETVLALSEEREATEYLTIEKVARRADPSLSVFKWVYYRNARERQVCVSIAHSDLNCKRDKPCRCDFTINTRFPTLPEWSFQLSRVEQESHQNKDMYLEIGSRLQQHYDLQGPVVVEKGQAMSVRREKDSVDSKLFPLLHARYLDSLDREQGERVFSQGLSPSVVATLVRSQPTPPLMSWLFAKGQEHRSAHIQISVLEDQMWAVRIVRNEEIKRETTIAVKDNLIKQMSWFLEREYGMEALPTFFPSMGIQPSQVFLMAELAKSNVEGKVTVLAQSRIERSVMLGMLLHRSIVPEDEFRGLCLDLRRGNYTLHQCEWVAMSRRAKKCYRYRLYGMTFHSSLPRLRLFSQELNGDWVEWVGW